jgi:hypothetical protein
VKAFSLFYLDGREVPRNKSKVSFARLLLAFLRLPSEKAQCFLLKVISVFYILSHFSSLLEDF